MEPNNNDKEEIQNSQKQFNKYQDQVQNMMAKHMLDLENFKRNERRACLDRQKQRLGEYITQKEGSKSVEIWRDGSEIRSVKARLEAVHKEIEKLQEQKNNIESNNVLSKTEIQISDANSTNSTLPTNPKEAQGKISAKINMLQKEENLVKEDLERLEVEKNIFIEQYKKQYEEDNSQYGNPNSEKAWPILQKRYQLLSLIGKGGFSEVYRAYDLQEMTTVACKVHQMNPNWSEMAKENLIKHVKREFEVHKELNHPNIVRELDFFSIDENSFGTVVEYCEGPDLSLFLKRYKSLPEKDAKIIIKQVLAGLKYLHHHKPKIIHYNLTPQNIFFHKGEVKISDFGFCKISDSDSHRIELSPSSGGSYWYLPPECFTMKDGTGNNKVEVWSVGVIYFEMLFGMKPSFGSNQGNILNDQRIGKSLEVNFPSKPEILNETKDFIKKCLTEKQDERIDVDEAYKQI